MGTGIKRKERKKMETMIDEEGYEVEGAEIQRVWKEAFEKLGKKGGQETFDENFTKSVENEVEEYKKILRKRYNNCKNVLNKARKKLRRMHKREVVREIEKLSTRYPGEYWRLLKQLTGRKKKKRKTMETMIDEEGYEVEGAEIQRVWKEAFEKLGKKGGQ